MSKKFGKIWARMNPTQKQELVDKLGSSKTALSHIAHGVRKPGPKRAMVMVKVLKGLGWSITRAELRPDLWLVTQEGEVRQ